MSVAPATYSLGPENGTLSVKTGRTGAAAKAGHDLVIEVAAWHATLEVADDPASCSVALDVDATSLHVRQGTGGMQALGDDDKEDIRKTIDEDVLKTLPIEFRSTSVETEGNSWSVRGDLTLVGASAPIGFELELGDDGVLEATAVVKQSDWGIKPYSALFGALKVADEVVVSIAAKLPSD
jgi:polyisoprenoid-binding protein YceI